MVRILGGVICTVLSACAICGCASFRQSDATRAGSFKPYAEKRIGGVEMEAFLGSRVAILLTSDEFPTNKWLAGDMTLPKSDTGFGCAAAIDSRGYFLTAAHCLTFKEVYLTFTDYAHTNRFLLRATVVWRGDRDADRQDLAVLHVRRELDRTFEWSGEVRENDPVVAVGLSRSKRNVPDGIAYLGGNILGSYKLEGEARGLKVSNDVPLQSGDSGGPLVDTEGRLIGLNTHGTPPFVHWILPDSVFPMITERPKIEWLQKVIEEDVRKRAVGTAEGAGI